jgi:hypothetical protein
MSTCSRSMGSLSALATCAETELSAIDTLQTRSLRRAPTLGSRTTQHPHDFLAIGADQIEGIVPPPCETMKRMSGQRESVPDKMRLLIARVLSNGYFRTGAGRPRLKPAKPGGCVG